MPTAKPRLEHLEAGDGVRLAVHRLGPAAGPPVVLLPGTFSNHTFWVGTRGTGFARALARTGYEAWVLDPRGHGESQRPAPDERWDFDDWARRDVPAVLRAADAHGGRPFLIGHSAGGAALLAALAAEPALRDRVRGIVVVATPLPWRQPRRRLAARAARVIARVLGRFPARLIRLGPEDELPGVIVQWMSWCLDGHWRGADGTDYAAKLGELRVPTLALAGAGDRLEAPPQAVRALLERIGAADRSFLLCGRDHGFTEDYDHTGILVSRAARVEVWPRILGWLAAHGGPAIPEGLPGRRDSATL